MLRPPDLKWIEIDLGAVRANIRWVFSLLKPGVRLMAVVKADAYGHGAERIGAEALKAGASCLGALTPAEGARLRRAGIRGRINLLAPILPESARDCVRLKLTPTLDSLAQARALDAAAPRGFGAHLDLDFGLGRWGTSPKDLPAFLAGFRRLKRLKLAGLSAHIDYVPGKNSVEAEEKLGAFQRIAQRLKRENPSLLTRDFACHAANSSILMDFPHWQMDQVRIGNLLYGINPSKSRPARLEKPWSFMARILAIRDVPKGRSIGYASEYLAPRRLRLATVAAGYSDGLTMEPAERLIRLGGGFQYWGVLRGRKLPFIGRCGIAHTLLDATAAPSAKIGDAVALHVRRTAANAHLPRYYKST